MPRRPTLSHQVLGALWEGVEASEEGWLRAPRVAPRCWRRSEGSVSVRSGPGQLCPFLMRLHLSSAGGQQRQQEPEQLPEARSHLTNRPERAPEYSVYPSCSGTEGSAVSLGNAALQAARNHLVRGSARPPQGSLALGPQSRDACESGAGTGHSGSRWTGLGGDHGWVGRMQKLRPQVTLPLLPGGGRPSSHSDR